MQGSTSPRLVYLVTHPVTADTLLRGQLAFMRERGLSVTVISAPGPELERVAAREAVRVVGVPMDRAMAPPRDAVALGRVLATLRRIGPHIVHASTPKAGLLGMLAAQALRVPVRIYLMRGLRLETTTGPLRRVLAGVEHVTTACAHDVACVSQSLLEKVIAGGYVPASKARVVGNGTSNGVDTDRFRRTDALEVEGARRLEALGVGRSDPVVGFVGRLVHDKGVIELLDAFDRVRSELPNAKLVLIGGDLGDERLDPALVRRVADAAGVIRAGTIADLAPYYARMNVLAFPSHREGFPNVPLEAASMAVPVVGSRATGVVDAIVDGETGAIVPVRDGAALGAALLGYLRDPQRSAAHGQAARDRAVRLFRREAVWSAWLDLYRARLEPLGVRLPA